MRALSLNRRKIATAILVTLAATSATAVYAEPGRGDRSGWDNRPGNSGNAPGRQPGRPGGPGPGPGGGHSNPPSHPNGGNAGHRGGPRDERGRPLNPGRAARAMVVRQARTVDPDEVQAVRMLNLATAQLRCDQTAEALRRLSNNMLEASKTASRPIYDGPWSRNENSERWKRTLRSKVYWQNIWDRLAETLAACDLDCFDDGEAVGQISGAGYCAVSVGLGGLDSPGFLYQAPLPLCQAAISTGCQKGYKDAVVAYEGCSTYASGQFEQTFLHSISQDCHL